jgi:hypothetical protein
VLVLQPFDQAPALGVEAAEIAHGMARYRCRPVMGRVDPRVLDEEREVRAR